MSKFHLPRCPYCGKKVNPFLSWYLRFQGEYRCAKCGGVSNVALDSAAYIVAGAAVLAALALFAVYLAAQQALGLWGILLVFIPFILFLALSILLIRLKKPGKPAPRAGAKNGRPPQGSRRRPGAAASENREPHTSQFSRLNLEKTTDLRYVQKTLVDQNMAHTLIRK